MPHYVYSIMSRICDIYLSQDCGSILLITHIDRPIIDETNYNLPYVAYQAIKS